MHCIDRIERKGSGLLVVGWFFKIGAKVATVRYRDESTEFDLEGYGNASEDIAAIFDPSLTRSRFEFVIDGALERGLIEFKLDDGSSEGIRLNVDQLLEHVVPLRHFIHDGVYKCKLKLLETDRIDGVSLSKGDVLDYEALVVESFEQVVEGDDLLVEFSLKADSDWTSDNLCIHLQMSPGEWIQVGNVQSLQKKHDPAHRVSNGFFDWIDAQQESIKVLEIGSRARSGITRNQRIDTRHKYLGIDVLEGDNVDLVCDAHTMSNQIEANSIDAAFSYAVFEHLAMPWKVAIEMNKVMKVGGRCMIFAPHSWPVHETPFDFWRFSVDTWRVLFNRSTGFKILESGNGEPAIIRPDMQMEVFRNFDVTPGYLCSAVIAEKTHETSLQWDVPIEDVYVGEYPH